MNIWFTSDTHHSHTNITGPKVSRWSDGYRNFDTVKDMNDALVSGINKYVKKGDILYHLGDWSFGGAQNIYLFRKQLVCENMHIISGNHDQHIKDKLIKISDIEFNPIDLFSSVTNMYESKMLKINKNKFYLSHYAHRVWPSRHHGVIHLFGHSHGNLESFGKSMDVGMDSAFVHYGEYRPFHINDIIEIMKEKDIKTDKQ